MKSSSFKLIVVLCKQGPLVWWVRRFGGQAWQEDAHQRPNLPFVNYAERSRRLNHQHQDHSYGSEPRKPHSRARLRDLGRTWLCARPSRSALACGRAGNLGGIDGRARPRTRPAKEATVACTFEDHQDPRSGQLTPHITTRGNTSAQTPSARGSRNKSFLLARRASQI